MMDSGKVDRLLTQLPNGLEPDRDLWPGIALRLSDRAADGFGGSGRSAPRWEYLGRYAAAAALVIVVGTLVFVGARSSREYQVRSLLGAYGPSSVSAESYLVSGSEQVGNQAVADLLDDLGAAERDYHRSRRALLATLKEVAAVLGEDHAIAEIEERFAAADQVVGDLLASVKANPSRLESIHRLAVFYGAHAQSMAHTNVYLQGLSK